MKDDVQVEEDELPQGSTPIWIDLPRKISHLVIRSESNPIWRDVPIKISHLEILQKLEKMTSSRSVTVLYEEEEIEAAMYSRQKNWDYRDWYQIFGCEDEVIIAIDCLTPETVTRPHNLLVIVTTPDVG